MDNLFNDVNRSIVGDELEKLYSFNDKHLTEIKKTHFINELESLFPIKAVIAGIKKMQTMDLKQIKMIDIKTTVRKFIEEKNFKVCNICDNTGIISAEDEKENDYAFACNCEKGNDISENSKMTKWNGKSEMWLHGSKYVIKFDKNMELNDQELEIYNRLKKGSEAVALCPF